MVKRMALKVQMMTQKCILKGVKDKEIEGLFCVSREGGPQGLPYHGPQKLARHQKNINWSYWKSLKLFI